MRITEAIEIGTTVSIPEIGEDNSVIWHTMTITNFFPNGEGEENLVIEVIYEKDGKTYEISVNPTPIGNVLEVGVDDGWRDDLTWLGNRLIRTINNYISTLKPTLN